MSDELRIPETRYAESDGLSIAYQVFGSGKQDLVIVPGIVSHLDADWDDPDHARMRRRFARSFRVIVFDKRGQGLSDHFDGVPTLEERIDDVRAVMQAAGAARAVVFAQSQGGAMASLFAAIYPGMVERLVIYGSMARYTGAPDYPHRPPLDVILQRMDDLWGKSAAVDLFAPSRSDDAPYRERFAKFMRQVASPSAIRRMMIADNEIDVRPVLPQIRRPTLIIHRRGDRSCTVANGRYFAEQIPGATYIEYPGEDHLPWIGDADSIVEAIAHFVGMGAAPAPVEVSERFVTTVLFTDIVGSTELATKLGDAKWRDLLREFHAIGRRQLEPHRGREIDTAGDGQFAIFDGPARAIRCATVIVREAKTLGIDVRAGLHTGEVEPSGDKVSGLAVHIGARVMAFAGAGEVLVSSTARDLVSGSGIAFEERGTHALKGVPGEWRLSRALAT
ncbi:MAG TPA: adenylate/guanylate cyclase domain-containing protein [Burkholderiales bacterium]